MAISVNPDTHVITVPQADLTLVSGTIYEHDTQSFRLQLLDWEDGDIGIVHTKTHNHNTEITIAGVTYARTIEILPPFSVEYEDGQYTVILVGSNNNIFDVANGILVQNQVQVIPSNSAGLITVVSGSGVTPQDKVDIVEGVWDSVATNFNDPGTMGEKLNDAGSASNPWTEVIEGTYTASDMLKLMAAVLAGKSTVVNNGDGTKTIVFRDIGDARNAVESIVENSERTSVTFDLI